MRTQLTKTWCRGGFRNAKTFSRTTLRWGVTHGEETTHYKRKKDALAVYDFITETDWNGDGDLESPFMEWAAINRPDVFSSYKGEA